MILTKLKKICDTKFQQQFCAQIKIDIKIIFVSSLSNITHSNKEEIMKYNNYEINFEKRKKIWENHHLEKKKLVISVCSFSMLFSNPSISETTKFGNQTPTDTHTK